MNLVQVNVINTKSFQRSINRVEDMLARQAVTIHHFGVLIDVFPIKELRYVLVDRSKDFGSNDYTAAWHIEFTQSIAQDSLTFSVRISISRVKKVDTEIFIGFFDELKRFLFILDPWTPSRTAICHATKANTRYLARGMSIIQLSMM